MLPLAEPLTDAEAPGCWFAVRAAWDWASLVAASDVLRALFAAPIACWVAFEAAPVAPGVVMPPDAPALWPIAFAFAEPDAPAEAVLLRVEVALF